MTNDLTNLTPAEEKRVALYKATFLFLNAYAVGSAWRYAKATQKWVMGWVEVGAMEIGYNFASRPKNVWAAQAEYDRYEADQKEDGEWTENDERIAALVRAWLEDRFAHVMMDHVVSLAAADCAQDGALDLVTGYDDGGSVREAAEKAAKRFMQVWLEEAKVEAA